MAIPNTLLHHLVDPTFLIRVQTFQLVYIRSVVLSVALFIVAIITTLFALRFGSTSTFSYRVRENLE